MNEYTQGTIKKRQRKVTLKDGSKSLRWFWTLNVSYTDTEGKRHKLQRDTDIPCSPGKAQGRGVRTRAIGEGSDKALRALAEWKQSLKDGDLKRAEEEKAAEEARKEEERRANDPTRKLVADYCDEYVDRRERGAKRVEPSTARSYHVTANQIRRYWPDMHLCDVRPKDVDDLEDNMAMSGLSVSSIRKAHVMLHSVFKELVVNDVLDKDPMLGTKAPTPKKTHPNAYGLADLPLITSKLAQLPLSSPVVAANLALYGGVRRGEAAGLRWSDVDLGGGVFTVRRAIGSGEHGKPYVKTPKTDHDGNGRVVPIPSQLGKVLAAWKRQAKETALSLGIGDISEWYVCGKPDGTPSDLDYLSKCWTQIARSFGITGLDGHAVTFHGLRHTYANALIHGSSVDTKTVSSIMGHSSTNVTENIYAEDDPTPKLMAAKEVDRVFTPQAAEVVQLRNGTEDGTGR